MKTVHFFLMIGAMCALILAAGCTGSPAAPSAVPTAALTAQPATTTASLSGPVATPALVERTWTGSWKIKWEANDDEPTMTLIQTGSTVTGIYDETGKLSGTVQGDKLVGTWTESAESKGPLEFTMAADNMSFTGTYKSTSDDKRFWDGTRVL